MAIEIERKFLVIGDDWRSASPKYYCQGYLNTHKDRTVRVRIIGDLGVLTVKRLMSDTERQEFEYEIPLSDAKEMLSMCEQPPVEKNRYAFNVAGFDWEVDEFLGANAGLVVAEIELESVDQMFKKPDWVGEDVSDDIRYLNSHLAQRPYSTW